MIYISIILVGYVIGVVTTLLIFFSDNSSEKNHHLDIYEHGYRAGYQAGVVNCLNTEDDTVVDFK